MLRVSIALPTVLTIFCALEGCGPARTDFDLLPTPTPSTEGIWPSVAIADGELWALFGESRDGHAFALRTARWTGKQWEGESLPSEAPSGELTVSGAGALVASWTSAVGAGSDLDPVPNTEVETLTRSEAGWGPPSHFARGQPDAHHVRVSAAGDEVIAAWSFDEGLVFVNGMQLGAPLLANVTPVSASERPNVQRLALELDSHGTPTVALISGSYGGGRVWVQRWDGRAWAVLGGPLAPPSDFTELNGLELALDRDGNPVIAIATNETVLGEGGHLFVQRWTGASWSELGPALRVDGAVTPVSSPALRLLPDGRPVVAFVQGDWGDAPIQLRRWHGGAWAALGAPLQARSHGRIEGVSLALEEDGTPVVGWAENGSSVLPGVPDPLRIHLARYTGP